MAIPTTATQSVLSNFTNLFSLKRRLLSLYQNPGEQSEAFILLMIRCTLRIVRDLLSIKIYFDSLNIFKCSTRSFHRKMLASFDICVKIHETREETFYYQKVKVDKNDEVFIFLYIKQA